MSPPADLFAPSSYAILKLYVHYQEGWSWGPLKNYGSPRNKRDDWDDAWAKKKRETIRVTSLNRFEEFQSTLAIYGLLLPSIFGIHLVLDRKTPQPNVGPDTCNGCVSVQQRILRAYPQPHIHFQPSHKHFTMIENRSRMTWHLKSTGQSSFFFPMTIVSGYTGIPQFSDTMLVKEQQTICKCSICKWVV